MEFILVPVPAEHVLAVMKWVLFRAETAEERFRPIGDFRSLVSLLVKADPELRFWLGAIAEAAIKNQPIRLLDLAGDRNLTTNDLLEAIANLNQSVLDSDRELIEVTTETAVGVSGNTGQIVHLSMPRQFALIIRGEIRRQAST
ncbi:MAG: hypothetical protein EXQ71_07370 [Acidimicrobiia bacterium]|nr:hypothetical protein [Acidimicrobiia bacterium]